MAMGTATGTTTSTSTGPRRADSSRTGMSFEWSRERIVVTGRRRLPLDRCDHAPRIALPRSVHSLDGRSIRVPHRPVDEAAKQLVHSGGAQAERAAPRPPAALLEG